MSNEEQIDYWSGQAGDSWVNSQDAIDRMMAPITAQLLDACTSAGGKRILDIGCGCGTTTLALAKTAAEVVGVDVSTPMLAEAAQRGAEHSNVSWLEADASRATFATPFDFAVSRFGVMFFANPTAAFRHLRSQLVSAAPLVFACWASPRKNPWFSAAAAALKTLLPPPDTPPDPTAPGPFAFANPEHVNGYLTQAGFSNLAFESVECELPFGATLDAALDFQTRIGPLSRALRELPEDHRSDALAAVRDALQPFATTAGVAMPGSAWLVSARA